MATGGVRDGSITTQSTRSARSHKARLNSTIREHTSVSQSLSDLSKLPLSPRSMTQSRSSNPTNRPSSADVDVTPHNQAASQDMVQRLKQLDEQAKMDDPERQARIERGAKRKTYGFGRFACFCLSGAGGAG